MAEVSNPKRQRQKEMRKAKLEEQWRQHRARRMRRVLLLTGLLGLLAAVLFIQFVGGDDGDPPVADDDQADAGDAPPQDLQAPEMTIDASLTYTAVISTSMGDITVELDDEMSPQTVNSFVHLAREDWYEGLIFHRIVPDFALQGGSPAGDGIGGPGYTVQDPVPADVNYQRGTVAMAKTAADPAGTSGSQFFIVPADSANDRLTPEYAVLGAVVDGFDVVDAMNRVEVNGETPVEPITIEGIEVTES